MRGIFLFVGGVVVGLAVQFAVAQSQNRGIVRMNHVAVAVEDVDAAVAYYTQTLGFPEAFRVTNDEGQVALVYVQVSRDSFVEIQPANDQRPPGNNHFGIVVEDMEAAAEMFSRRGANVDAIRGSSTHAILSNIHDPNSIRIELAELPPESLHYQAMEAWE
ncbi:MAG: VOC family protein [Gammaproteobacteria bacterium]